MMEHVIHGVGDEYVRRYGDDGAAGGRICG